MAKTENDDSFDVLDATADVAAKRLLGCVLARTIDGKTVRVKIVETEAYDQTDVASHSYSGQTPRTEVMFGPAGHAYVYFTYGMHYCCNIVVGKKGHGSAVLIRAVEPIDGIDILQANRPHRFGVELTNGPAKLCQALGIDKKMNGHDLQTTPMRLYIESPVREDAITTTTRIGISKAKETAWRFYISDNPYVSVQT